MVDEFSFMYPICSVKIDTVNTPKNADSTSPIIELTFLIISSSEYPSLITMISMSTTVTKERIVT
jgi:hypothetical protein